MVSASNAPTNVLTQKTIAPALAATFTPSDAPSNTQSQAPTIAPTETPTIFPSPALSLPPTVSPTATPSAAPTFSPTRVPTVSDAYTHYIDVIYELKNLINENAETVSNHIARLTESGHASMDGVVVKYSQFWCKMSTINDYDM